MLFEERSAPDVGLCDPVLQQSGRDGIQVGLSLHGRSGGRIVALHNVPPPGVPHDQPGGNSGQSRVVYPYVQKGLPLRWD